MKQSEIDALAHHHTLAVLAIAQNFETISKDMIQRRGTWSGADGGDVLTSLLGVGNLASDTARHVARAIRFGEQLPSIIQLFTPEQKRIVSTVEASLIGKDADGVIKTLKEFKGVARAGSELELIFKLASAIVADGKDAIYDPVAFAELTGRDEKDFDVAAAKSSAGEVLADDVAGAVVGGIAGAVITAVVGGGPGAAGGGTGGAIMWSGKAIWVNIKTWWDGTIHGETDPVGPIGGEWPEDI